MTSTQNNVARSALVHGPGGCGKTTHAKQIATRLGLTDIVDEYFPDRHVVVEYGVLYLMGEKHFRHMKRDTIQLCFDSERVFSWSEIVHYCQLPERTAFIGMMKDAASTKPEKPSSVEVNTEQILEERGSRYGSVSDNSRISQELKDLFDRENQARILRKQLPLMYHQKEALDMIAAKICRILSGDPEYADNWDDIAGYAQLGKNPR